MDTKQQPQVPQLQLAKVGERKRRKGGALPFFSGSGAASHSGGGGIWGTVSGIAGKSVLKIGITLLAGAIGVGAYNTGKGMRPDPKQFERKPTLFASKNEKPQYSTADVANLPGGSGSSQSSVGLVSGSRDDLTQEQRDAQARAEAEKAKKAAEEQAKADAAAAKEPENVPGAGMPDPIAAAKAAAEKEKAAAFNRKFGELSKGGGSSLAGGAGMGSGIGRGFESLPKNKGTAGVMSSLGSNRAGGTSSAKISSGRNPGRSLAQRQLNRAVQSARQMTAGANETRAAAGAVPFDTNQGNSQLLSGAGGGSDGGSKVGKADSNPTSSGGGGGSPVGVGGYGDTGEDDCGTLAAQYGWGGNFVNSASGGCVLEEDNVEGTGKDDPTNSYFNILKILSILAALMGVLLLVAALLQKNPYTYMAGRMMSMICGAVLCGLGAIIAIMGLMLVGMGRQVEGGIFAAMGLLESIAGYLAYSQASEAAEVKTGLAEQAAKESAKTLAAQCSQSMIYTGAATGGLGGAGGGIYANNVDPRTWNSDTNQWE